MGRNPFGAGGASSAAALARRAALGGLDHELAERAAGSVLQRLAARLTRGEATDLVAQLPRMLVDLLDEPRPERPIDKFGREELLAGVAADLGVFQDKGEVIVRAVFATVRAHISEGEAEKVGMQLPRNLEALWAQSI
jgi:uncharacterized protein (DUF2267 family)